MIATVTLNPALDQHIEVENLVLDDTNRWVSFKRQPGGKGINVSRVLTGLGGETVAYGFIGGHAGDDIVRLLKEEGVRIDFTRIRSEIRSNFIITDLKTHRQTRISAPGPHVTPGEFKNLVDKIISIKPRPQYIVFAGSVPPGVPFYIYRELIERMKVLGIKTVLDTADMWLIEGVRAQPDIIKPNVREAQTLLGMELKTEEDIINGVKAMVRNGVGIAAISRGPDGMIVADASTILKVIPPEVEVLSTVGAGDSTVAGLVLKLSEGGSLEEASRLAVAAGTAATLTSGTELCHKEDVERLLPLVKVEKLTY